MLTQFKDPKNKRLLYPLIALVGVLGVVAAVQGGVSGLGPDNSFDAAASQMMLGFSVLMWPYIFMMALRMFQRGVLVLLYLTFLGMVMSGVGMAIRLKSMNQLEHYAQYLFCFSICSSVFLAMLLRTLAELWQERRRKINS